MRMKEDYMLNGQLKPAYNIQIGVVSGYIVNFMVSQERTDVNTLILFLEGISKYHKYKNIVADASYESLENYRYLNKNNYKSYIKHNNNERTEFEELKSSLVNEIFGKIKTCLFQFFEKSLIELLIKTVYGDSKE